MYTRCPIFFAKRQELHPAGFMCNTAGAPFQFYMICTERGNFSTKIPAIRIHIRYDYLSVYFIRVYVMSKPSGINDRRNIFFAKCQPCDAFCTSFDRKTTFRFEAAYKNHTSCNTGVHLAQEEIIDLTTIVLRKIFFNVSYQMRKLLNYDLLNSVSHFSLSLHPKTTYTFLCPMYRQSSVYYQGKYFGEIVLCH